MEMLTEIRFLLNFKMDSYSPMGLIIIGQSELRETLKKPAYHAIAGRVELRCHLPPFVRAQTVDYIACHLKYAGSEKQLFTENAISAIYDFSGGIARKINRICNICLIYAAKNNKNAIDEKMTADMIECEFA